VAGGCFFLGGRGVCLKSCPVCAVLWFDCCFYPFDFIASHLIAANPLRPQNPPAYGGDDIVQSHTVFLDSHWGVGASVRELVHGVDCPLTAAYLDVVTLYKSMENPVVHKNALCVFETDQNVAALRHYDYAFQFYGAVKSHALTVRAVSEVYNYDYICDFNFYVDGTMEPRVQTSGCVLLCFLGGGPGGGCCLLVALVDSSRCMQIQRRARSLAHPTPLMPPPPPPPPPPPRSPPRGAASLPTP